MTHSPKDHIAQLYPRVNEEETPLPRAWTLHDKYTHIGLSQNNLRAQYKGLGKTHRDAESVRTADPIPAACGLYYFEIKVISKGRDGYIGVGLCSQAVSMNKLPGWEKDSYGYHADDGNSFSKSGIGEVYGPTFSTGDVVGCGVNLIDRTCFYTKNGIHLGIAFKDIVPNLYPTVGLQTPGEVVDVNFGQKPFVFDIDELMVEMKCNVMKTVKRFPHLPSDICWQSLTQQVVCAYLVHYGFTSTAESFAKSTGQSINEELSSIRSRQRIQKLILSGRISEAIITTQTLYPTLLDQNQRLYFRLNCRQFVEMVSGSDGEIKPMAHSPTRSPCCSPARSSTSRSATSSTSFDNESCIQNGDPEARNENDDMMMMDDCVGNGFKDEEMDVSSKDHQMPCNSVPVITTTSQGPSVRQLCGGNLIAVEKLISFGRNLRTSYKEMVKRSGVEHDSDKQLMKILKNIEFFKELCGMEAPHPPCYFFERKNFLGFLIILKVIGQTAFCVLLYFIVGIVMEVFSLLAYSNPWESPVGYLFDVSQREMVCSLLNSAILEMHKLPGKPALEVAIGQTKACLKTMARHGIGACALVDVEDFFCDR